MEKLTIWMLGWEVPLAPHGRPEAWLPVARSLDSQAHINVLLPHNHPPATLANGTITDLDTVELPVKPMTVIPPESLPFAPIPFPPPTIPLYGTPVYTGKETGNPGQRQPGEAVRTGHKQPGSQNRTGPTPPSSLHAQVIAYARKVSRFSQGQKFDAIYAFHWQTYLAALELKLVTGNKMVLQVHALSQDRHFPDRLAWMQEIEKQAFEKADAILVDNDPLAATVTKEYGFAAAKLSVLDWSEKPPETLLQVFSQNPSGLSDWKAPPDQSRLSEPEPWALRATKP